MPNLNKLHTNILQRQTQTHKQVFLDLEAEVARATPIPLTPSRPTAKASNLAMACCILRSFVKQATTSQAPLVSRVLLAPSIPLLVVSLFRLASRVPATPTLQQAPPLARLRVQAARPCRLALHVHATKLATTPRAVRVFIVQQVV